MKMSIKCWNCNANIIYKAEAVNTAEYYYPAKAKAEGNTFTIHLDMYDKRKIYSIVCPQCNKGIKCGEETLEEDIDEEELRRRHN